MTWPWQWKARALKAEERCCALQACLDKNIKVILDSYELVSAERDAARFEVDQLKIQVRMMSER